MLSKYNRFLNDRIFENVINESRIYYSTDFKSLLKSIDSPIAFSLLSVANSDVKPDITFIDNSEKDGFFTFTQFAKAKARIKKTAIERGMDDDYYDWIIKDLENGGGTLASSVFSDSNFKIRETSRSDAKIGKLVTNLFPGKYTDKEVEDFVNKFKAKSKSSAVFELVEGDEIIKWYNVENYISEDGELGNSCMRHKYCSKYFSIYTENPDVCKLLILKEDDKIFGRALLWKVNYSSVEELEDVLILDRIYTTSDKDRQKFINYAVEQGWAYRSGSCYSDCSDFIFNNNKYSSVELTVDVKEMEYDLFPYMDTFKRYSPSEGILYNDADDSIGFYVLTDTDGGYDDNCGVYSEYLGIKIDRNNAIYSDPLDSWIYKEDCVRVRIGRDYNRGYYPDDCYDICRDEFRGEYLNREDAFWSDYDDDYIYSGDETDAITQFNSIDDFQTNITSDYDDNTIESNRLTAHEYLANNDIYNDFHNSILTKTDGKYFITNLGIQLYDIGRGNISAFDAKLLGIELVDGQRLLSQTDTLTYNYYLDKDLKKEIQDKCESEMKNNYSNNLEVRKNQFIER